MNIDTEYLEIHYEISVFINDDANEDTPTRLVGVTEMMAGIGGLYELTKDLTDKFYQLHKGTEWTGEFYDTLIPFLQKELL